jgi:hypothetical protein
MDRLYRAIGTIDAPLPTVLLNRRSFDRQVALPIAASRHNLSVQELNQLRESTVALRLTTRWSGP